MAPSRRRRPNAGSRRGLLARLGSLYAAYLVSQTGNWVFRAAALYDIYDARGGSLAVLAAGVTLAYLPILIGSRLLAPLADRLPARTLLVSLDLIRVAVLLPLLAVDAHSPAGVALNLAVIGSLSLTSPVFTAGQSAHIRRSVGTEDLTAALGLLATIEWLTFTAGTSLGALLLLAADLHVVVAVDMASFAASAIVLACRLPAGRPAHQPRDRRVHAAVALPDGARIVLLSVFLLNLGAGLINLYPNVLAREVAGAGHPALSAFYIANGIGGLIGATIATRAASRLAPARMMQLAAALVALSLVGMSRISAGVLPLLTSSAMLLFGQLFAVGAQSWLLTLHPPSVAGRASGRFTGATFTGVAANAALAALLVPTGSVTTGFVAFIVACAGAAGLAVVVALAPFRRLHVAPKAGAPWTPSTLEDS